MGLYTQPNLPKGTEVHRLAELFKPEERTITTILERMSASLIDRPLIKIGDRDYSCNDLRERAGATADTLRSAGVGAGDRVGVLCRNRIEFLDLFFACAWLNAVVVPINLSSRGPQLHHILRNSRMRLLVIESDAAEALQHVATDDLALDEVWLLPPPGKVACTLPRMHWRCRAFPAPGRYIDPVASSPADTAAIIYTSGTTGPSKGVCCPHAQFFWWGAVAIDVLEITDADVLLTTLPLFHINALGAVFQALLSTARLVVLERFSASGFVPSLHEHHATLTYLLGAMVPILLSTPPTPRDRTHKVRRALAPGVPAELWATFSERFGVDVIDGYGSTETNFVIGNRLKDQVPAAMGRVRPGFAAEVVDANDNPQSVGTPGELVIRSDIPYALASGYFMAAEATVESRRNLWFHTGDRVYQDQDGNFFFMGRLKDAIRRRGENISAYEVEQVLLSHPVIANAAVYAVASELAEDEVMAAIVLQQGTVMVPETLLDFCQPRMSYFSVPRYIRFVESLPMTDNGKIQKFKLREQGITTETWDREAAGYSVKRPGRVSQ